MSFKQLCQTLQQCTELLEQEVKSNLNEFHNLVFGRKMSEVKLALERAKDYHYNEIAEAVSEMLKHVKQIIFHQDKLEWLSDEANFTANDLKRFSYVKRQVYAFSQPEEKPAFSRSVENLTVSPRNKRERRRTASEISVGSLEAWEKYLDQKEKDESGLTENVVEVKKTVPKRTLSNARARKKFVSSTMGGFLDDFGRKGNNLDSIVEDSSLNEEVDEYDISKYLVDELIDAELTQNGFNIIGTDVESHGETIENNLCRETDEKKSENGREEEKTKLAKPFQPGLVITNLISMDSRINSDNEDNCSAEAASIATTDDKNDIEKYDSLVDTIKNSAAKEEDIINEIMKNILEDDDGISELISETEGPSSQPDERIKPKIVDVIYKKKPC